MAAAGAVLEAVEARAAEVAASVWAPVQAWGLARDSERAWARVPAWGPGTVQDWGLARAPGWDPGGR